MKKRTLVLAAVVAVALAGSAAAQYGGDAGRIQVYGGLGIFSPIGSYVRDNYGTATATLHLGGRYGFTEKFYGGLEFEILDMVNASEDKLMGYHGRLSLIWVPWPDEDWEHRQIQGFYTGGGLSLHSFEEEYANVSESGTAVGGHLLAGYMWKIAYLEGLFEMAPYDASKGTRELGGITLRGGLKWHF